MPVRKANAHWQGGLKDGKGNVKLGSGAFEGPYSFGTRFEEAQGTNPEELIAAAEAGCFAMALSKGVGDEGFEIKSIDADAKVSLEAQGGGFAITKIELIVEAEIPGISNDKFQELAKATKENCPVSKALQAVEMTLDAKLKQ